MLLGVYPAQRSICPAKDLSHAASGKQALDSRGRHGLDEAKGRKTWGCFGN